jgi:copper transport protein
VSKLPLQVRRVHASRRLAGANRWMSLRLPAGAIIVVLLVLFGARPALAHTSFESSSPADGAVFDAPVSLVTVSFTNPATPVGDEFVALDSSGQIRTPTSVTNTEGRIFELTFDPALSGGQVGIRWKVQAGDAHPIEGAFSFTVNTPVATETTVPAGISPIADSPLTPSGDVAGTTLDEFLSSDSDTGGETTATLGRIIGLLGVVLGIGALVFVASTLRGTRSETNHALNAIRVLGLVIATGATIEYIGVVQLTDSSLFSAFTSAPGFAAALRFGGGLALALGLVSNLIPIQRDAPRQPMALSSAVLDLERLTNEESRPQSKLRSEPDPRVRWHADATSWPAFAGMVAIIISFWFDGHTVSKGFRPLHALTNSVHLVAGSVWAGGVIAMAVVLWRRYRHGRPMRAHELVLRFSPIATIALAAVAGAGLLMAVFVLDSFAELTGTPWGQILMLKTAAVGLAAIGGAYNHFRLIPALEVAPDDEKLQAEVRSTITAEAIMLFFVVVVTAWLVAAAS